MRRNAWHRVAPRVQASFLETHVVGRIRQPHDVPRVGQGIHRQDQDEAGIGGNLQPDQQHVQREYRHEGRQRQRSQQQGTARRRPPARVERQAPGGQDTKPGGNGADHKAQAQ